MNWTSLAMIAWVFALGSGMLVLFSLSEYLPISWLSEKNSFLDEEFGVLFP